MKISTLTILGAMTSFPEMAFSDEMLKGFIYGEYGIIPSTEKIQEARQLIKIQGGN